MRVIDLVWFQRDESELSSKWSPDIITEEENGEDELVRRTSVKYLHSSENNSRES